MRHYKICYPSEDGSNVNETLSERDIINHYFDYWSHQMSIAGQGHSISYERCIEDWVIINWAEEV